MRLLATLNVGRQEKAVFDAFQAWLSYREGRAVHQWEVFAVVLEAALTNPRDPRVEGFGVLERES